MNSAPNDDAFKYLNLQGSPGLQDRLDMCVRQYAPSQGCALWMYVYVSGNGHHHGRRQQEKAPTGRGRTIENKVEYKYVTGSSNPGRMERRFSFFLLSVSPPYVRKPSWARQRDFLYQPSLSTFKAASCQAAASSSPLQISPPPPFPPLSPAPRPQEGLTKRPHGEEIGLVRRSESTCSVQDHNTAEEEY